MKKNPITFREKVEARYQRKSVSQCWIWDGSLAHGRPALNLRPVNRFIYTWERGPIPLGHTLYRMDHVLPECLEVKFQCRHHLCVNPWHMGVKDHRRGLFLRERSWPGDTLDHHRHYYAQRIRNKKNAGIVNQEDRPSDRST